jgi:hypothetical protein
VSAYTQGLREGREALLPEQQRCAPQPLGLWLVAKWNVQSTSTRFGCMPAAQVCDVGCPCLQHRALHLDANAMLFLPHKQWDHLVHSQAMHGVGALMHAAAKDSSALQPFSCA